MFLLGDIGVRIQTIKMQENGHWNRQSCSVAKIFIFCLIWMKSQYVIAYDMQCMIDYSSFEVDSFFTEKITSKVGQK